MVQEKMWLKDIIYLELWQPLCLVEQNDLCYFGRKHHEKQSCELFFEFRPVVQEEMSFKGISYLKLWRPFCSAELNHLCNSCRWYYEEQFYEFFSNLDRWFRKRCHLKLFLIWCSSGTFYSEVVPFVQF